MKLTESLEILKDQIRGQAGKIHEELRLISSIIAEAKSFEESTATLESAHTALVQAHTALQNEYTDFKDSAAKEKTAIESAHLKTVARLTHENAELKQQDPFQGAKFDRLLGIWKTEDHLGYCPVCKSNGKCSPLRYTAEWYCCSTCGRKYGTLGNMPGPDDDTGMAGGGGLLRHVQRRPDLDELIG